MTEQQILSEFKALESGSSFISEKIVEFGQKYPRHFIAVKEDKLLAVGESFEEVLFDIKKMEIDPGSVLIEYIPDKEEIILY